MLMLKLYVMPCWTLLSVRENIPSRIIQLMIVQVKQIYYPKHSPTKPNYDECRNVDGGYGGLLSVTFTATAQAIVFFDELDTAKGPSLGTNFTLR